MRRIVSVLVLAVVAAVLQVAVSPPATALAAIVGQIVQYGGSPVPGTTVRLHQDDGGAPGALVDTTTADSNGQFSLTPAIDGPHWVEVVRNRRVQGGFVSDSASGPSWVQFDAAHATPVDPGTRLGRVLGAPSFISGKVVDAASGNRLQGTNVSTRDVVALGTVLHADATDANGFFRIPIWGEDFGLRVNGRTRGYENGWRACDGSVVPTWGAACASPVGPIGKVRLDRR